jgi:hypothetical protein
LFLQRREVVTDGAPKRNKIVFGREPECRHLPLHFVAYSFSQVFSVLATLPAQLGDQRQAGLPPGDL